MPNEQEQLLDGFPVSVRVPIAWADMDVYQHVNNTVFFRFFETARIEYLQRIGFDVPDANGGIGAILASTHCRFRIPLVFPDHVRVGARTTELSADRFVMEYRVISESHSAIAAEGGGTVVSFDYGTRQKAAIPAKVRRAIAELSGGALQP